MKEKIQCQINDRFNNFFLNSNFVLFVYVSSLLTCLKEGYEKSSSAHHHQLEPLSLQARKLNINKNVTNGVVATASMQHSSARPLPAATASEFITRRVWMGGSCPQRAGLRANGTRPGPHRTHTPLPSPARAFTLVAGTKSALVNEILLPVESGEGLAAVYLRRPLDNRPG